MSEPVPTDPGTEGQGDPIEQQGGSYTPPASQADLDRIVTDRVNRTKAQFKDYNELKTKAAELDQLRQASQTEAERKAEELTRWQTEAQRWQSTAVGSTITALASADFTDPSDAVTALADPAKYLDAGGQIDEAAIKADLEAVLERKPHWRRSEGTPAPRVPTPNPHQGSGGSGKPVADPAAEFGAIIQGQLNGSR